MKTTTINSFEEYLSYTEPFKGKYYFRGQGDASWTLLPTLFRHSDATAFKGECAVIEEVITEKPRFSVIEALFYAQHNGKPTRILDLTVSVLNALCFATEGDADGVVYVIDKKNEVSLNSLEMGLITVALTDSSIKTPTNKCNEILRNYVVGYKDLVYSNSRAFRQGGTGIVFGFGDTDISDFVIEKIIIPSAIKRDLVVALDRFGICKELLYAEDDESYSPQEVTISQTEFTTKRIYSESCEKITAKYKVSGVLFDRDSLAGQISVLYKNIFEQYGGNARVWTFFYYDDNDKTHANWICRGEWHEPTQFRIVWTKGYHAYRLNYLNEQISSADSITRMFALADKIMPLYNEMKDFISQPDYEIRDLLELASRLRKEVYKIKYPSDDIPFTDVENNKVVDIAHTFIDRVDWLIGDLDIMAKREENNEKAIRYLVEHSYLRDCEKARLAYETVKPEEEISL